MDRRLVVILILLLSSGIALTLAAYIFGVFPFDVNVSLWLWGEKSPALTIMMRAVSSPGDSWAPVIVVFAAAAVCALYQKWIEALFVIATLSSGVLSGVLKMVIGRPRPSGFFPNQFDIFPSFNQYAYPSGHVLFYVVFFGFVAFLAWKHLNSRRRWIVISICAVLIVLIGPSRIYLGEHWLSDVIGSYIIGTFWLIILVLVYIIVIHRAGGGIEGIQDS